jgi:hypothetical protein
VNLGIPEFASYLIFEGHDFSNQFNISVTYDDVPLLPQCTPHCELEDFISLMKDGIPQIWEDECKIAQKQSRINSSFSTGEMNIFGVDNRWSNFLFWLFGCVCGITFIQSLRWCLSGSQFRRSKSKMS